MNIETIHTWILQNPFLAATTAITLSMLLQLITRIIIAKSIVRFAKRSKTKVDDILVEYLNPCGLQGLLHSWPHIFTLIFHLNPVQTSAVSASRGAWIL